MIGYSGATSNPSNNHGARRECDSPDLVVLHYTAMETAQKALERLCSSDHEVSAHYLILHQVKFFSWLQKTDAPGMRASLIGLDSGM
jgi:N-acetyl-anhydromuramyl-L-alanine amidase AmpD